MKLGMRRGPRHRLSFVLAVAVSTFGLAFPAGAEDPVLPRPCKLHPDKVLNPGCVPALTEAANDALFPWTLPDLVPDAPNVVIKELQYDPVTGTFVPGPPQLFFDTYSQNVGTVALELTADEPGNLATSPVSQCVSWAVDHVCRQRRTVGGFVWHEGHDHYHFEDFASYQLRRLDVNGRPDYSAAGLLSSSDKVSFCMMDSAPVENPDFLSFFTQTRYYTVCNPVIQGISAGWADIYSSEIAGQQLPLTGVNAGRYALVIDIDHGARLYESDDGNNVLELTIEISDDLSQVTIVDRRRP